MKTGKIFKILFAIVFILLIGLTTNHVKAATSVNNNTGWQAIQDGLNNNGGISLRYSVSFGSGTHVYKKDTRGNNAVCDYPFKSNNDGKFYGGAWAYLLANYYQNTSTMQSLFWEALNGNEMGYRYYNSGVFANSASANSGRSAAIKEAQ